MKKLLGVIVLGFFTIGGFVYAQNTQRTPLQGGTTNPTTPSETHGTVVDPKSDEDVKPKKKKSKKGITASPVESTPVTTPEPEPESKTK